jgi:hypothetical protein
MSQERPMAEAGLAAPRRKISVRVEQLRRAPAVNIVGIPELIGLAGAAFLAVLVIFAYIYFYVPAGIRLKNAELERTRLMGMRTASSVGLEQGRTTKENVDRITSSLTTFEGNWLASPNSGQMSLYTVLNKLIKSNGLRNTAGPTYSPLEPIGTKKQVQPTLSAEKQSNAKWESIYPGIAVTVTVEGPYQNIRHFVHDLESSRQFLIINAVELERVTQNGATLEQPLPLPAIPVRGTQPRPSAVSGSSSNTLVSLRMDLSTYFQRGAPDNPTP